MSRLSIGAHVCWFVLGPAAASAALRCASVGVWRRWPPGQGKPRCETALRMLKTAASCATLPAAEAYLPSSPQEPAHVSAARILPGESRQRRRFAGDPRVARRALRRHRQRGPRARPLPARAADRPGAAGAASTCRSPPTPPTSTPSRPTRRSAAPATSRSKSACAPTCAGTRWRWWSRPTASTPPTAATSAATSPRFASLAHDVRRRLQPLLACRPTRRPRRRPALHPGPFVARHLRPRLPGRPPHRGAAAQLPPGSRRQGPVQLSASEADARLLAVPDRLDGPRPADGDLPGALPEVPACARHRRHRATARSGCSAATARWTSPNRWAPSAWPRARSSTT